MRNIIFCCVILGATVCLCPAQQKHECMGTGHELGEAVDIDGLNDKPVSLYGKDPQVTQMVEKTQYTFNHPPNGDPPPMENYGPAGLWRKRTEV